MYSLVVTAKMNDVDPQAWLADVLALLRGQNHRRLVGRQNPDQDEDHSRQDGSADADQGDPVHGRMGP